MIYLIMIFGLALRLISLNQSLWLDEATTAIVSRMSVTDIFTKFLPGDFHPPLYYLFIKYWSIIIGSSEILLRLPSVLFGVATIYVVYKISKNYVAPFFVATSGLLIYYSQEARMYCMTMFLTCLSAYFFMNKKWFWFSVIICLVGMTDYVALFILPVFVVYGFINMKSDFKKIWLSLIPLFGFFLIWMPIFIKQFKVGNSVLDSNWSRLLGVLNFKNTALIPVKFILGRISFDNKYIYALIVFILLCLFGYILFRAKKSLSLIWLWLITPILVGMVVSFKIPILTYFRFLFCLPALYILIASGLENSGKYKKILLALVIIINIVTSFGYLFGYRFQREDWRLLAESVGKSTVIFPSDSQKEALIYYGKGNQIEYYKNFKGGESDVWLSRYIWQVFDPNDFARLKLENLGYNKVFETDFNGVVLDKYAYSN